MSTDERNTDADAAATDRMNDGPPTEPTGMPQIRMRSDRRIAAAAEEYVAAMQRYVGRSGSVEHFWPPDRAQEARLRELYTRLAAEVERDSFTHATAETPDLAALEAQVKQRQEVAAEAQQYWQWLRDEANALQARADRAHWDFVTQARLQGELEEKLRQRKEKVTP